jgi:hypothetical protein
MPHVLGLLALIVLLGAVAGALRAHRQERRPKP